MTTQSREQQIQIDNTEKALDLLKKWFEEDNKHRGFILIKSEIKEKEDDTLHFNGNCAMYGNSDVLKAGLVKSIGNTDGALVNIFASAIEILLLNQKEREENY